MTEIDIFNQALAVVGDYRITTEATVTAASATAANPVVVTTSAAHGYSTDDLILQTEFDEMTEVNGRVFKINVLTTTTYQLVGEDGSGYTAESTGGLSARLSTGDEVTAVFDLWPAMRKEVLEEHSWRESTKYGRLARLDSAKTITAITQASPAVVTIASHGYSQGDILLLEAIVGMVELNGRYLTLGTVTTNTFQLAGIDSTEFSAYTSGGTAKKALQPLTPDHGFDHRYTIPSDAIRVFSVGDNATPGVQWEVVQDEIYTDEGITVPIRYAFLLTDPAKFSGKLTSAFAARLGHELAPKLTNSTSREERVERKWDRLSEAAKSSDNKQQGPQSIHETSWITARSGGTP